MQGISKGEISDVDLNGGREQTWPASNFYFPCHGINDAPFDFHTMGFADNDKRHLGLQFLTSSDFDEVDVKHCVRAGVTLNIFDQCKRSFAFVGFKLNQRSTGRLIQDSEIWR